jgi:hypothetical protein
MRLSSYVDPSNWFILGFHPAEGLFLARLPVLLYVVMLTDVIC